MSSIKTDYVVYIYEESTHILCGSWPGYKVIKIFALGIVSCLCHRSANIKLYTHM
jgi:hypothetical protein